MSAGAVNGPSEASLMEIAISMAAQCQPRDPRRVPKVGAVVVVDGNVVAASYRGEEEHAEKLALLRVPAGTNLAKATVYTTLEPCTRHVRSQIEESCTERLIQAHVKRVVIGILDPNQGVCGRGVLALQKANIEVDLFPHALALRVMGLNEDFIRAQQTLGMTIETPKHGMIVRGTSVLIEGFYTNSPQQNEDVVVFVGQEGLWSVQPPVQFAKSTWSVEVRGAPGLAKVQVARTSELGKTLVAYHRAVAQAHERRAKALAGLLEAEQLHGLPSMDAGIPMPSIPKGLDHEDSIELTFAEDPPAARAKPLDE